MRIPQFPRTMFCDAMFGIRQGATYLRFGICASTCSRVVEVSSALPSSASEDFGATLINIHHISFKEVGVNVSCSKQNPEQ